MPGVKGLHQESESNSKSSFIMGHSFQAVGILVGALKSVFSVPLVSRIHEGVVVSNRDKRTLLDKMIILIESLGLDLPFYYIADAYHFWMKPMKPIKRYSGNQYIHKKPEAYRKAVQRKMDVYHRFVQTGLIAQGLLQYLSTSFPQLVFSSFGSWFRTIRTDFAPSELVTAIALRQTFPEFLSDSIFKKFIIERIDLGRAEGLRLVA